MTLLLIIGLIVSVIGFIVMRQDDDPEGSPGGVDRVPYRERTRLHKEWKKRGLDYHEYMKIQAKLDTIEYQLDEIKQNESHERG